MIYLINVSIKFQQKSQFFRYIVIIGNSYVSLNWVFKNAVTLRKMHPLIILSLVVLGHTAHSITRNTKSGKFATKLINEIEKHELLQNATKKYKILRVSNIHNTNV